MGSKRKAGCSTAATPCSSLAQMSACQAGATCPASLDVEASSPDFRNEAKRVRSLQNASCSNLNSLQSESDFSLLLDVTGPSPAAQLQHEDTGLLLCEEGLECKDTSPTAVHFGPECSSPHSWDNVKPDARCRSASTLDSQQSEGSSFVLPPRSSHQDFDASSSPEECAVVDPYAMSTSPSSSGSFTYRHVPEESLIGCMATMYGFTPCTISVGTAYFERIAARDPTLLAAARATPEFTTFVAATPADTPSKAGRPIGSAHIHLGPKHWLTAIHLACIYIAAKNVEFVPYKKLLSTMLSHVHNQEVAANAAADLELEVLQALQWRLGPFFRPAQSP
ncbi:hypothetical protein WJX75_008219 [Coccomyxa subellipsoidea]|uniref:Cyclin N-terminal domain-containing protein n=1 Tax=Coccomyxa subellipsoidea TaxID=248742 RepID=A0ABR2YB51_9CHLO